MQYRPNTALRFIHPDFDGASSNIGIQPAGNGKIAMVSGRESVRQAIIMLLSTIPGERVMRPNYGCDLPQLAFMPNDATSHGLAIHYVRMAISQWEPRVDILDLDADQNVDNPSVMDITLKYRIRHSNQTDQITVAYQIMGDEL